MDQFMSTLSGSLGQQFGDNLIKVAFALVVFLLGWVIAKIIATIVTGLLKKTTVDNKIAEFLSADGKEPANIEGVLGTFTYYLLMILVFVAVFDVLGLEMLTKPLNELLGQIALYLPRILGAAVLLGLAFFAAAILRVIVRRALEAIKLDQKLVTDKEEGELPISKSLSELSYWIVFLLFLPAFLNALDLQGLLEPVQTMMDQFLGYIPNVVGATIVLGVGWFAARILERVVSNLLAAGGADQFSKNIGLSGAIGEKKFSQLVGLLVYILVLLPAVVAALDALQMDAVTDPVKELLATVINSIPLLIGAGFVLLIAHVLGKVVADLLTRLTAGAGFDKVPELLGFQSREGSEGKSCSQWIGTLLYAVIMVTATIESANLLRFEYLSDLVGQFLIFALQIFAGMVIFGVGLYLANLASKTVASSSAKFAPALAAATRIAILFLAGAMALQRMGLADEIIQLAFGLLLGAVAVAIALSFGLGARNAAAREVESWLENVRGGKSS